MFFSQNHILQIFLFHSDRILFSFFYFTERNHHMYYSVSRLGGNTTVFVKSILRESWVNGITATSSRGNASMALQNFSRDLFYESLKCILDSRFGFRFAGGQHPLRAT